MTPATSSKLLTAELVLRVVRVVVLTLAAFAESLPGEESTVVGTALDGAAALPKTVEPKVLPATASVNVIGVK